MLRREIKMRTPCEVLELELLIIQLNEKVAEVAELGYDITYKSAGVTSVSGGRYCGLSAKAVMKQMTFTISGVASSPSGL
jgi:hypothetical protein